VPDFAEVHADHLQGLLEADEQLRGVAAATQQSAFSGRAVAIAVTDRRLLVQPLDRRGRAKGDALSLPPEAIASAQAGGAGGGWATVGMAILDHAATTLQLRTTGGDKLKLTLMQGGSGMLGALGGGASQEAGVQALADWFQAHG
jgi:hypothetical protein